MTQPEMEQFKVLTKQDYKKLLNVLVQINTANEGFASNDISDGERLWYANILANKLIGHALTILYLSHGTVIQDLPSSNKLKFLDSASIDVLTRATMEAFLVFHYVFFAPTTTEEKNLRYCSYKAAGIVEWQKGLESTSEHEHEKAAEKKELDNLHDKLKSNAVFQSLTETQKTRFFEGKE